MEVSTFNKLYTVPTPPEEFLQRKDNSTGGANWKPYRPYLSMSDLPTFNSMHWGQRKLLLTEILFFALHGKPNTHVIYAGAAPGEHNEFLCELFPTYTFDLVDPAKWNAAFSAQYPQLAANREAPLDNTKENNMLDFRYTINPRVTVWHGFFTDDLAHYFRNLYNDEPVLFVSDIRTTHIEELSSNLEERDQIVRNEMKMQMTWFNILNEQRDPPIWAMFKFKVTFGIPSTTYLRGTLYYQPWAPLKSPELRLITNAKADDLATYNNDWIEQHLVWYNENQRNKLINRVRFDIPIDRYGQPERIEGLNKLWDTQFEYDILSMTLGPTATPYDIYHTMKVISEHLQKQGGLIDVVTIKHPYTRAPTPTYCFMKGYVENPITKKKKLDKLIQQARKYTSAAPPASSIVPPQPTRHKMHREVLSQPTLPDHPTIFTIMASIPLTLPSAIQPLSISLEQLMQAVQALFAYTQPLSKYAQIYIHNGFVTFVDLIGSIKDGKRFLATRCINLYCNNTDQVRPSFLYSIPMSLEDSLQESLPPLDKLAYLLQPERVWTTTITNISQVENNEVTVNDTGLRGIVYAVMSNQGRVQGMVNKITKSDERLNPMNTLVMDKTDIEIYKAIRTEGRHVVKSSYKVDFMIDIFLKVLKVNPEWFQLKDFQHLDVGGASGDLSNSLLQKFPNIHTRTMDVPSWGSKDHKKEFEHVGVEYDFVVTKQFPYMDRSFDLITMIQTLHHIDDSEYALREIWRVLQPGGFLFVREHSCETLEDKIVIDMEHMLYEVVNDKNWSAFNNFRANYFSRIRLQQVMQYVGFREMYHSKPTGFSNCYYTVWQKPKA